MKREGAVRAPLATMVGVAPAANAPPGADAPPLGHAPHAGHEHADTAVNLPADVARALDERERDRARQAAEAGDASPMTMRMSAPPDIMRRAPAHDAPTRIVPPLTPGSASPEARAARASISLEGPPSSSAPEALGSAPDRKPLERKPLVTTVAMSPLNRIPLPSAARAATQPGVGPSGSIAPARPSFPSSPLLGGEGARGSVAPRPRSSPSVAPTGSAAPPAAGSAAPPAPPSVVPAAPSRPSVIPAAPADPAVSTAKPVTGAPGAVSSAPLSFTSSLAAAAAVENRVAVVKATRVSAPPRPGEPDVPAVVADPVSPPARHPSAPPDSGDEHTRMVGPDSDAPAPSQEESTMMVVPESDVGDDASSIVVVPADARLANVPDDGGTLMLAPVALAPVAPAPAAGAPPVVPASPAAASPSLSDRPPPAARPSKASSLGSTVSLNPPPPVPTGPPPMRAPSPSLSDRDGRPPPMRAPSPSLSDRPPPVPIVAPIATSPAPVVPHAPPAPPPTPFGAGPRPGSSIGPQGPSYGANPHGGSLPPPQAAPYGPNPHGGSFAPPVPVAFQPSPAPPPLAMAQPQQAPMNGAWGAPKPPPHDPPSEPSRPLTYQVFKPQDVARPRMPSMLVAEAPKPNVGRRIGIAALAVFIVAGTATAVIIGASDDPPAHPKATPSASAAPSAVPSARIEPVPTTMAEAAAPVDTSGVVIGDPIVPASATPSAVPTSTGKAGKTPKGSPSGSAGVKGAKVPPNPFDKTPAPKRK